MVVTTDKPGETEDLWPDGDGPVRRATSDDDHLIVDVAGFEGPLDLLLQLARNQKVDITRISILALAEQYLSFIDQAKRLRMELAADYLVMAAWLAFLKSRLLLPHAGDDGEDIPAEELAARLAFRLQRLQAMREAAAQLMARNVLGRDVFQRGQPEPLVVVTEETYADNLIDLLKAYAERRQRRASVRHYTVRPLPTWSIKEARAVLERLIGVMDDWSPLDQWMAEYLIEPERRRTVLASSLSAGLELAREGHLELRQEGAFKPIFMRRRALRPVRAVS